MSSFSQPTRIVYSRDQLLALEPLCTGLTLPAEAAQKFDVIEVGDPVPAFKRRDPERVDGPTSNAAAGGSNSNGGGGARERDDRGGAGSSSHNHSSPVGGDREYGSSRNNSNNADSVYGRRGGDDRFARPLRGGGGGGGRERGSGYGRNGPSTNERFSANDRFYPISRDGREGRGSNRNQETFDEGVKYELERNAEHMRRIQETLDKEVVRNERTQAQEQQREAAKDPVVSAADRDREEIDRLLAAVSDDSKITNARRSRFFDTPSASAAAPTTTAATTTTNAPAADSRWKSDASMWSTAPMNPPSTMGASNVTGATGINIGGITIAGGVANLPAQQLQAQQAKPPQPQSQPQQQPPQSQQHQSSFAPITAAERLRSSMGGGATPSQEKKPASTTVSSVAAAAAGSSAPAAGGAPQVWRAQDLEQMLKSGGGIVHPSSSAGNAAAKPPAPFSVAPNITSKAPINAADLESMLLQQTRAGAASNPPTQPPPQAGAGFTIGSTNPGYASSVNTGARTPPQQLPASLQGQPSAMTTHQHQQPQPQPQQWFALAQPPPPQQQQQKPAAPAMSAPGMAGKMPMTQPMQQPHQAQQAMMGAGGLGYPMMLNPQGQPIAVTAAQQQQWLQLMQQQQQQQQQQQAAAAAAALMFRRQDGSAMFMQPSAGGINPFATNAQFLFQQQQQQQHQHQHQHR